MRAIERACFILVQIAHLMVGIININIWLIEPYCDAIPCIATLGIMNFAAVLYMGIYIVYMEPVSQYIKKTLIVCIQWIIIFMSVWAIILYINGVNCTASVLLAMRINIAFCGVLCSMLLLCIVFYCRAVRPPYESIS